MKKNYQMSKKERQKKREKLITIVFIGALVLVLALALIQSLTKEETVQYIVTQDGHVHTADGTHVGSVEEMFGENGVIVTEDGHVHAADGSHLGEIDVPADAHDHEAE